MPCSRNGNTLKEEIRLYMLRLDQLTEREMEILNLLAAGLSNRDIAERLCITTRTVKFHTGNIYMKLTVESRSEAISWAWRHGVVQSSQMSE